MALRKIKLYGKLGQIFGKEWILDVNSVAEAVRAIDSNTKGKFSLYLLKGQGSKQFYKISVKNKKNIITEKEINGSFGSIVDRTNTESTPMKVLPLSFTINLDKNSYHQYDIISRVSSDINFLTKGDNINKKQLFTSKEDMEDKLLYTDLYYIPYK